MEIPPEQIEAMVAAIVAFLAAWFGKSRIEKDKQQVQRDIGRLEGKVEAAAVAVPPAPPQPPAPPHIPWQKGMAKIGRVWAGGDASNPPVVQQDSVRIEMGVKVLYEVIGVKVGNVLIAAFIDGIEVLRQHVSVDVDDLKDKAFPDVYWFKYPKNIQIMGEQSLQFKTIGDDGRWYPWEGAIPWEYTSPVFTLNRTL